MDLLPELVIGAKVMRMTRCVALGGLLVWSSMAWSQALFDFFPSEGEWATWPPYCQARYVVSSTGRTSQWAYGFPEAEIQRWQQSLGSCWNLLHHQCAGTTWLARARLAESREKKSGMLGRALDELTFARKDCRTDNPFSATLLTTLGMTYEEAGKHREAIAALDDAMKANSSYDGAYIAKSIILRRAGKSRESLDVLLQGERAIPQGTAELNNAIGLAYCSSQEYEKAREYARKAYKMGYPLPGLLNKLKKAGYPL
jgi:tetratricopeptide (TPR) repeat protein